MCVSWQLLISSYHYTLQIGSLFGSFELEAQGEFVTVQQPFFEIDNRNFNFQTLAVPWKMATVELDPQFIKALRLLRFCHLCVKYLCLNASYLFLGHNVYNA